MPVMTLANSARVMLFFRFSIPFAPLTYPPATSAATLSDAHEDTVPPSTKSFSVALPPPSSAKARARTVNASSRVIGASGFSRPFAPWNAPILTALPISL